MASSTFGTVRPYGLGVQILAISVLRRPRWIRYEHVTSMINSTFSWGMRQMTSSEAHSRSASPEQTAEVMAELATILSSGSFSSSKRCRDFLEYVVKRALMGEHDCLTERFLGVELFGRAVDYETATDSIVRVRANDVRRRLAQYYSGQRATPSVRIDLIAGGYIPEFHWETKKKADASSDLESTGPTHQSQRSSSPEDTLIGATEPQEVSATPVQARWYSRKLWWSCIAGAVLAATILSFAFKSHQSNFRRFWKPVLNASSVPLLVLPTTNTFQLEPNAAQNPSQLKPGESVTLVMSDVQTLHNWHVSLPVLQTTLSVALALQRQGKTPLVRIGTDLKMDEVRGHPIIAIGSFSNPWTQQNVTGLRFTFDRGASDRDLPRIRDAKNSARTWSISHIYPASQDKDYAIVTRTFDPTTREPFISLAGLHSFGNQIAGEFVSQESSWDELAKRAPSGWENMNLQIVLETNIIGTTTSSPRIVDVYFWK